MTPTDRKALREAARAATPGPWRDSATLEIVSMAPGHLAVSRASDSRRRKANARYIALANPAALESLLDRMERLEEALEHVKAFINDLYVADLEDVAADGGITVGMVFQQQAATVFLPKITRALNEVPHDEAEAG